MLNLFKKDEGPVDVKTLRYNIVQFIKAQLQKWEGGEGKNIRGLQLFLSPTEGEKHLYEAAVFVDEENKFKEEEIQRIADDFAIELPSDWTLEMLFVEALPAEAISAKDLPLALHISTRKQPLLTNQTTAYLTIINGEAELPRYILSATGGKVCIGREKHVQTMEGFMRENNMAFSSSTSNKANQYISRQHAHIEWDKEAGAFFLYADEGGIPPRNKVKVQSEDGRVERLQSTMVGHLLRDGDQILLGEAALIKFEYGERE